MSAKPLKAMLHVGPKGLQFHPGGYVPQSAPLSHPKAKREKGRMSKAEKEFEAQIAKLRRLAKERGVSLAEVLAVPLAEIWKQRTRQAPLSQTGSRTLIDLAEASAIELVRPSFYEWLANRLLSQKTARQLGGIQRGLQKQMAASKMALLILEAERRLDAAGKPERGRNKLIAKELKLRTGPNVARRQSARCSI